MPVNASAPPVLAGTSFGIAIVFAVLLTFLICVIEFLLPSPARAIARLPSPWTRRGILKKLRTRSKSGRVEYYLIIRPSNFGVILY